MDKQIEFQGKSYTQAALNDMTDADLLTLRNLVASNLGVQAVKSFTSHDQAVSQTWKALERFETTVAAENAEAGSAEGTAAPAAAGTDKAAAKAAKEAEKARKAEERAKAKAERDAAKANKEPKERGLAKSADAKLVKRPSRSMFATIHKIGEHNGSSHQRAHRWPNYNDGMTMVDVIETQGTEPWDVHNWVDHGIMEIRQPTDEEYTERRAAWYAKHKLKDPEAQKLEKAKAKEEAKVAREKAAAERKAAKEAAAKAKADAKAAKEAAAAAPTEAQATETTA